MKDYTRLSDDQLLRDKTVLQAITDDYVIPLRNELSAAIEGYEDMGDYDKYFSLLRLNMENAPRGDWAMVDFGYVRKDDEPERPVRARTAMYAGWDVPPSEMAMEDGSAFLPWHLSYYGEEVDCVTNPYLLQDSVYLLFPPCVRIATVANLIFRNVLTTIPNACRYVAGMDRDLRFERVVCETQRSLMPNTFGQIFGWTLRIRDTEPEDKMMLRVAQGLRANVVRNSETIRFGATDYTVEGSESIPLFAEHGRRRPRESTRLLRQFIDEYLPSMGHHVGRSGEGTQISWDYAFELFSGEYPNRYATVKSFRDSYYNAKRNQGG